LTMETLLDIGVGILRLIPLILAFYIPALFGMATWSEGDRTRAMLWFAIGFGAIVAVQILFSSVSAVQLVGVVALSLLQIAAALSLAALTVYKLAD
jgi:heme A synthase